VRVKVLTPNGKVTAAVPSLFMSCTVNTLLLTSVAVRVTDKSSSQLSDASGISTK
jgi:hypothetical protein